MEGPEPEPLPWLNEYLTFPLSFSFQFPQALTSRLGPSQKREPCELKIADFDDVLYKLFVPPETPNLVTLHCAIKDWKGVKANGGGERLEEIFPGCVVEAEEGFDVAVRVDADNVPKGPWGSTGGKGGGQSECEEGLVFFWGGNTPTLDTHYSNARRTTSSPLPPLSLSHTLPPAPPQRPAPENSLTSKPSSSAPP